MTWHTRFKNSLSQYNLRRLLSRSVPYVYKHLIRRFSPQTDFVYYNDIPVSKRRLLDSFVPKYFTQYSITQDKPDYETELISSIRSHIKPSDDVVVVGGGLGVSSAVAAKKTGANGRVVIYEGSSERISEIENTLRLNDVRGNCEVNYAIVGSPIHVHGQGTSVSAEKISADELPKCDVLEMDCEGSELDILESLDISPRVIVVETHEVHGSPVDAVKKELKQKHYRICDQEFLDAEKGVAVITALSTI